LEEENREAQTAPVQTLLALVLGRGRCRPLDRWRRNTSFPAAAAKIPAGGDCLVWAPWPARGG